MTDQIDIVRQYRKNGDTIVEIKKGKNPVIERLNLGRYPDTSPNCTLEVTDHNNRPY